MVGKGEGVKGKGRSKKNDRRKKGLSCTPQETSPKCFLSDSLTWSNVIEHKVPTTTINLPNIANSHKHGSEMLVIEGKATLCI